MLLLTPSFRKRLKYSKSRQGKPFAGPDDTLVFNGSYFSSVKLDSTVPSSLWPAFCCQPL